MFTVGEHPVFFLEVALFRIRCENKGLGFCIGIGNDQVIQVLGLAATQRPVALPGIWYGLRGRR